MFTPVDSIVLITKVVQKEPNLIVKPIAVCLGWILNFVFNIFDLISRNLSMGLAIILFTIIVRILMLPIAFKQQKSMSGMQRLQPEVEKIRKKYNSKDPEVQKKMNTELQALYSKEGVNPFSGCLPILIQFPIFIALMYIMNQPYMFVTRLGEVYGKLAEIFYVKIDIMLPQYEKLLALFDSKKGNLKDFYYGTDFPGSFEKALNVFTPGDWNILLEHVPADIQAIINPLLIQKDSMEYFLTMNLQSPPGWGVAGIILLTLAVASTFLSSWLMTRQNKSMDENAKMQQRIMMFMMPIMMGYFTVTMPAGVGIYWISSSIFQIFQQIILNRYYNRNKG